MRRSRSQSSSLDLLLDTLTNALGSIMLIAILVALTAGPIPTTPTEEAPQAEEEQIPGEPEPLLADLPTTEVSQQRIQELTAEIQSYKSAGVQPRETSFSLQDMYDKQGNAKDTLEKQQHQAPINFKLERPTYFRGSWTKEQFNIYMELPTRDIICSNGIFYFSDYVRIGEYPPSSGAIDYTVTNQYYSLHVALNFHEVNNYSYSDPQQLGRILWLQFKQRKFEQIFIRTDVSSILQAQQLRNELARRIPELFIADIKIFKDNDFFLICSPANIQP